MPWDQKKIFLDQYYYLYTDRLKKLRKRVIEKLNKQPCQISQVQERVGIIKLAGMIKRIQTNRKRAFQKQFKNYYENIQIIYDKNDILQLQDFSGRIILQFQNKKVKFGTKYLQPTDIPHGVVVGISGKYNKQKNIFVVKQIITPKYPPQKDIILKNLSQNRRILIMSQPTIQQIQKFLQFIICQQYNVLKIKRQIKSIIIMGFSDYLTTQILIQLNELLNEVKEYIDIFLMPSGNTIFPQKAYHPIMFRKSFKQLGLCSNPQTITIQNGIQMLLFCGENIKDLIKNCSYGECNLDILQLIVQYGHINPCCPFSLKCQMTPEDYLIIQSLPHIIICGKCDKFAHKTIEYEDKKVKLVTIPKQTSILLNMDNLQIKQISYQ